MSRLCRISVDAISSLPATVRSRKRKRARSWNSRDLAGRGRRDDALLARIGERLEHDLGLRRAVDDACVVVLASMLLRSSAASGERAVKPTSCTVRKRSSGARFSSNPQPATAPATKAARTLRRLGIRRRC